MTVVDAVLAAAAARISTTTRERDSYGAVAVTTQ
jgi:hypothetical protein